MRTSITIGALLPIALLSVAVPASGQDRFDTFCVRVSEPVQAKNLNTLVVRERVTIQVVSLSECAQEAAPTPDELTARDDLSSYLDYITHVSGVAFRFSDLSQEITDASGASDLDELADVLGRQAALTLQELAWLDANPARPCYAASHHEWRSVMEELRAAAETTQRGVEAFDADLMEEGIIGIGNATTLLSEAGSRLRSEATDCID